MDIQFLLSFAANSVHTLKARKCAYQLACELVKEYNPIQKPRGFVGVDGWVLNTDEIIKGKDVGRIDAIRAFKLRSGLPLIDAKRIAEKFFELNKLVFKSYHNG